MTEVTTYKCDVCGKVFNNAEYCHSHELGCKTNGLGKYVVMMSSDKKILPLDNWKRAIEQVYFLYVTNSEASNKLKDLFEEFGYDYPTNYIDGTIYYPAFFVYSDEGMYWRYFQDIENEYSNLLDIKDILYSYIYENDEMK